jgi:hypothetical protein
MRVAPLGSTRQLTLAARRGFRTSTHSRIDGGSLAQENYAAVTVLKRPTGWAEALSRSHAEARPAPPTGRPFQCRRAKVWVTKNPGCEGRALLLATFPLGKRCASGVWTTKLAFFPRNSAILLAEVSTPTLNLPQLYSTAVEKSGGCPFAPMRALPPRWHRLDRAAGTAVFCLVQGQSAR